MAPRFRTFCTHPARVTVSFTLQALRQPHVWVLYMVSYFVFLFRFVTFVFATCKVSNFNGNNAPENQKMRI